MSHEGMYMVTLMFPVVADDVVEAQSLVMRAVMHTPMSNYVVRVEPVEMEEGQMAPVRRAAFVEWLVKAYPEAVETARKSQKEMDSWGKFLCEAEEGVPGA